MSSDKMLSNQQIMYHVRKVLDHALQPRMQVLKLNKQTESEYYRELTIEHDSFRESNPALFFAIADNPKTFDMNRLKDMLEKRKKLINKEISKDTADKEVGQKYFEEFVQPHINDLDKK